MPLICFASANTSCSGPVHLHLLRGVLMMAVMAVVAVTLLLVVAPRAVVVAPRPQGVVVVISLLARMIVETTIVETAETATALAAQMIG
jgi:hypothetical protein